jgi:hypothetical protein
MLLVVEQRRYQLYVQSGDRWEWLPGFDAVDHAHAFQEAVTALNANDYDKPIRLEQRAVPTRNT